MARDIEVLDGKEVGKGGLDSVPRQALHEHHLKRLHPVAGRTCSVAIVRRRGT